MKIDKDESNKHLREAIHSLSQFAGPTTKQIVKCNARVSLIIDEETRVESKSMDIRFTQQSDKRTVAIEDLGEANFHTEFDPKYQRMRFNLENKRLIISGDSPEHGEYKVRIHLKNATLFDR